MHVGVIVAVFIYTTLTPVLRAERIPTGMASNSVFDACRLVAFGARNFVSWFTIDVAFVFSHDTMIWG